MLDWPAAWCTGTAAVSGAGSCLFPSSARAWLETGSNEGSGDFPVALGGGADSKGSNRKLRDGYRGGRTLRRARYRLRRSESSSRHASPSVASGTVGPDSSHPVAERVSPLASTPCSESPSDFHCKEGGSDSTGQRQTSPHNAQFMKASLSKSHSFACRVQPEVNQRES